MHPTNCAANALLIRYDEIAMKGRNRSWFERLLIRRFRSRVDPEAELSVRRDRGRIVLAEPDGGCLGRARLERVRRHTPRVFGVASVSPCVVIQPALAALEHCVERLFPALYEEAAARTPSHQPVRYAMRARRHGAGLGMSSRDVEIHFADRLLPQYPRLAVDLTSPDIRIDVEIREREGFVSWERIPGPGGLPVGVSGTAVALLSGGIDSPVACWRMMKRGCRLHFVTFHSSPYTPPETVEKIARLVRVLNECQIPGRLFAVNLLPFQKQVRDACQAKYRTLLYRRMMVRTACWLADRVGAGALVTGDCLAQVASQTLRNLNVIHSAADRVVLQPLIGFDKQETIATARAISTLEISNEEVPDSCTVFAPSSPSTGARPGQVERQEHALLAATAAQGDLSGEFRPEGWGEWVNRCVRSSFEVDLSTGDAKPFPWQPDGAE